MNNRQPHIFLVVSTLAAALTGCSGAEDDTAADTTDTADTSGSGNCNALDIASASVVNPAAGSGSMPAPAGGTLANGVYLMTSYSAYAPSTPSSDTYQVVLEVADGTMQLAQIKSGVEDRYTFSIATSGSDFTATSTCPVVDQVLDFRAYTATATEFSMFNLTNNTVITATKQ